MKYLSFPNETQWKEIYGQSSFPKIFTQLRSMETQSKMHYTDFFKFLGDIDINETLLEVHDRIADAGKSFVMLTYYFEQGIPDDEWFVSPSLDGKKSIQYLPHFEEKDFYTKDWFDYYVDNFYHKLFAAWDMLSHLIDKRYKLDIERPDFSKIVKTLKSNAPELHRKLQKVVTNPSFKKAKKIRNDITHNRAPSSPGLSVTIKKEETSITGSFGVRNDYITSKQIIKNIDEVLLLFEETIQILTA